MGTRSLCDLPGWAEWSAQHRAELSTEELDALLAWRVRLEGEGSRLPAEGFDWFLREVRRSLSQARHRGLWPVPAPAPTDSPEPPDLAPLTPGEVEALLQRARRGDYGPPDIVDLAATVRALEIKLALALEVAEGLRQTLEESDLPRDPQPYTRRQP